MLLQSLVFRLSTSQNIQLLLLLSIVCCHISLLTKVIGHVSEHFFDKSVNNSWHNAIGRGVIRLRL